MRPPRPPAVGPHRRRFARSVREACRSVTYTQPSATTRRLARISSATNDYVPGWIRTNELRIRRPVETRPARSSHVPYGRTSRVDPVASDGLRVRREYGALDGAGTLSAT